VVYFLDHPVYVSGVLRESAARTQLFAYLRKLEKLICCNITTKHPVTTTLRRILNIW